MITDALLATLACPVCLEPQGCATCTSTAGHAGCADYAPRVRCGCGGPDKVALTRAEGGLVCSCCAAVYAFAADGSHVNLVPKTSVGAVTHYADAEFQDRLAVMDNPPLLSARVKADMMRRMLAPGPTDVVVDLGCGAGKFALYAAQDGARVVGLDVAPFFLPRAARTLDLVLGDLRRLPFRKGACPRAYSLDVLEHLDEEGVREVLLEARRTIGADGRLFVYTHAMESSRIAGFQRAVNRLAKHLGERGLIDHEREAMRKSDHVNAIRSHEHFDELCASAGLEVAERRYYNVVAKAVVEDLLLRLLEQRGRKTGAPHHDDHDHDHGEGGHHHHAPEAPRLPPTRFKLMVGHALSWVLKLDVVLFGGVRTGPFFGLLRPRR